MGYQVFQRQKGWIFGDSVDQNIKITVIIHEILAKANQVLRLAVLGCLDESSGIIANFLVLTNHFFDGIPQGRGVWKHHSSCFHLFHLVHLEPDLDSQVLRNQA